MIEVHPANPIQLFSQRTIGIATFVGGPLAAGILVRKNYINLGKSDHGMFALAIGILSTLLLFGTLFIIPEHIANKIPNAVFPAIYTAIIYLVVEKLQGKELALHKQNNGSFYSGWKAAGIGAICMLILASAVFGYAYFKGSDFDVDRYDKGITEVQKNETAALKLFEIPEATGKDEILAFIKTNGIPNWIQNIRILNDLDKLDGLTEDFKKQNQLLKDYCQLRIKSYQLIEKGIREGTNAYEEEIAELNKEIDSIVSQL
jgi:hypothetical protein